MVTVDAPPSELPATHVGTRALKRDEDRTAVEMRRFIVRFELGTALVGGSNGPPKYGGSHFLPEPTDKRGSPGRKIK